MDSQEKKYQSNHVSQSVFSPLIVPLTVFVLLASANIYFWNDYSGRRDKIASVSSETHALLSGTEEDQKLALDLGKQKLSKLQSENALLRDDLASTTAKLQEVEIQILKNDVDIGIVTASIADETAIAASLLHDDTSLKTP